MQGFLSEAGLMSGCATTISSTPPPVAAAAVSSPKARPSTQPQVITLAWFMFDWSV